MNYDAAGNPILPAGVEEFLAGNPSTFIDRYLRVRHGPIVKATLPIEQPDHTYLYGPYGAIADDPTDVTVSVNNIEVGVKAVIGLLGIIVLDAAPGSNDVVKVSYRYLSRPIVDFRRLNSMEFILNADGARAQGAQRYLYRNVLVDPSVENPLGHQGGFDGTDPALYGYFYRGFERVYSVALNDPNLLLLNAPYHKIAYPPFNRSLEEVLVSYDCDQLPESHPTAPWVQEGIGTASVATGILTLQDTSAGPYPVGQGFYYYRVQDLSYSYTMSLSFRNKITAYTLKNQFTGVCAGYLDNHRLCLISFLEDGGTKYVGILKKGGDETTIASYQTYALDWTTNHIFRLYRDETSVRLYIDTWLDPLITVAVADLADPNELEIAIPYASGIMFGSMLRETTNTSEWDFFRYLVTPTSLSESKHNVTVLYEANQVPTEANPVWARIGSLGHANILFGDNLLLNKTSLTTDPSASGLLSGDYYGYYRPETFLTPAAISTVDFDFRGVNWTHAVSDKALGMFVNDGSKLLGLSFFSDTAVNTLNYTAKILPEDDPLDPWTKNGTAVLSLFDNVLQITDNLTTDGVLYTWLDVADEILPSDLFFEFRARVLSYTADSSGFCGVVAELKDYVKNLQVMLRVVGDIPVVSIASNETVLASVGFNWADDEFHTYRLVINKTSDVVLLFIDGIVRGTYTYSMFGAGVGLNRVVWGSKLASSVSESVVQWCYVAANELRSSGNNYVGIYLGGTVTDPANYLSTLVDFSAFHQYRLTRDPNGDVALSIDDTAVLTMSYLELPTVAGSFFQIQGIGPGVFWGSFDTATVSYSEWDYVRYSVSTPAGLNLIAPHHQIQNQQNVMASPDHLKGLAHGHTDFDSCSRGIPYPYEDYLAVRGATDAYTKLNADTPPVPLTQNSYLTKVSTPISGLNDPLVLLNDLHFLSNDSTEEVDLQVNPRGLYNTLDMRVKTSGNDDDAVYPAFDYGPSGIQFDARGTYCFNYDAVLIPEDTDYGLSIPRWLLNGTGIYESYASGGVLTFSNTDAGNRYYTNANPVFGARYPVDVTVACKVTDDISGGTGDTSIRFEVSTGVYCIRLGFFTSVLGEKIVQVFSVASSGTEHVIANITFDWDDAAHHIYRLSLDRNTSMLNVYIDGRARAYRAIPYAVLLSNTATPRFMFTPKFDTALMGKSEILVDYIHFCVSRDEVYTIPPEPDPKAFYLNATFDYVYNPLSLPSVTVPARSLMNTTGTVMFAKPLFSEAYPALAISGNTAEVYAGVTDEYVEDAIVIQFPWGGNIMNDLNSLMRRDMATGWLQNDFTAGASIHPYLLTPALTSAVLGASLTLLGTGLLAYTTNYNHDIRIVIVGVVDPVDLTAGQILSAGGLWNATTISIPLSLIPSVVPGSSVKVKLYTMFSNDQTIV